MRRISNIRIGAGMRAAGIIAPSPMAVTHAALACIMANQASVALEPQAQCSLAYP